MIVIENGGCEVLRLDSMAFIPRIGESIIFDSTLYVVANVIHCIDSKMTTKAKIIVDKIATYE